MSLLVTLNNTQVLAKLDSSQQGLSNAAAKERQLLYGKNELAHKPYQAVILEAISHAINPLVIILFIAALISAFTGNMINANIIITIIVFSVGLDYLQSHKALVAIKKLQQQITTSATVMRDGYWTEVPCNQLVPGDIIRFVAGNLVPADSLLLTAKDLHVHQSALTGESLPVEKESIPEDKILKNPVEAKNAIFSGSSIINGVATAVIVNTGSNTLFGQIAESLKKAPPRTEFEKGTMRFGAFIMKAVFFLVIFVFSVNIYLKRSLIESLLFAVALAVGLTPELLPMITTVTLAAGAAHMARKKVIVKNLSAIQNFGSIDVLCSDKTGTLTSGEMALDQYTDPFGKKDEHVLLLAYLTSLFGTGVSNPFNKAVLKKTSINPLDIAILKHDHPSVQKYNKLDEVPFDFERRRSSVVVDKNEHHLLITKGAPEYVLKVCTTYDNDGKTSILNDETLKQFNSFFASLSQQGYRVLGVAYKKLECTQISYNAEDEQEMIFAGFLAFSDPPLSNIPKVIKKLNHQGVKVKIITGDNDLVATHVCKQVGLDVSRIVLGEELDRISDSALGKVAEETEIFARISPAQKQRIIIALKTRGHVVGYLGDGINDAPSLHSADVGISVAGAVDIARESADIILLKQDLSVLLNGIIEGRKSFGNVMKYLMMGTSSNFGNMLSMAGAVLFLPFLPMLPVQILLNNLLYDTSQITIPTDNVDSSFIKKPKHWNIDVIKKFMFFIGPISSLFDFITFYVMLNVFAASEALFQTGWFVESLATQTLVIFVIRTAKTPWQSKPSLSLTLMVLTIVSIGVLLPFSPLAKYWGFVPLPPMYFLFLTSATVLYLGLVEIIKKKLMWRWLENR
ncbi:magnesium-translocating P-type ATPase [Legionella maioricensis]|uniref:Magnesium-transporting ATPase, P-type 1 n=1 Tax=Legionella maioricensis TaxID=2896528 RepID=A0A9X2IBW0_9GAMM|nr:magnesium-translocating P-type ATPase [Legionella maioricensis]MCL9685249.1 magnesium-translocating P-type ATPase [Legionella maioricensis]MCL9688466.1 magnesium-translocating P-type ATPase [Legionella maioricensis]